MISPLVTAGLKFGGIPPLIARGFLGLSSSGSAAPIVGVGFGALRRIWHFPWERK